MNLLPSIFFPLATVTFFAMARPQPDSRVDNQSPAQAQTCRMEVLRRDAWPSGGTQLTLQSRQRCRTVATQTSAVPAPVIYTQDAVSTASSPQQEGPLRDSAGIFIWSVHVHTICFTVCLTECLTSRGKNPENSFHVLATITCFVVEIPGSAFCPSVTCCNLPWASGFLLSSTQHSIRMPTLQWGASLQCFGLAVIAHYIFPEFPHIVIAIIALVEPLWCCSFGTSFIKAAGFWLAFPNTHTYTHCPSNHHPALVPVHQWLHFMSGCIGLQLPWQQARTPQLSKCCSLCSVTCLKD